MSSFRLLVYPSVCLAAMIFNSCQPSPSKAVADAVRLQLNADSTQIVLKGLDHNILQSIREDLLGQDEFESIFSVYRQSANEQLTGLEKPFPGKYQTTSTEIIYIPDSAFLKGQTYRAEFRMPAFYDQKDIMQQKKLPGAADIKAQEFKF
jgi:hypothetical protein